MDIQLLQRKAFDFTPTQTVNDFLQSRKRVLLNKRIHPEPSGSRRPCEIKSAYDQGYQFTARMPHKEIRLPLSNDLRDLINLSHALAWKGAKDSKKYKSPDEPGLVAAFLDAKIQSGLETALKKEVANKAHLQVDSVFTHKTPLVKPIKSKPAVEIGDLLLVRQHFSTTMATAQGMALLLQAKKNKAPNSGNVSAGNPLTQFKLYRKWPSFEGDSRMSPKPNPPSPDPWNFLINRPRGRFGQYLAIFDGEAHELTSRATLGQVKTAFSLSEYPPLKPPNQPKTTWSRGVVEENARATEVACLDDFADVLAAFFLGKVGESFAPGVMSGPDHWSLFVNTMLGEAANKDYTFLSRRTNIKDRQPRGAKISTFLATVPLVKLAISREFSQYIANQDKFGFPDFSQEPHFYNLCLRKSGFMRDLNGIVEKFLGQTGDGNFVRPPPNDDFSPNREDGGGHVPILSIATSGPEPLWDDFEMRQG